MLKTIRRILFLLLLASVVISVEVSVVAAEPVADKSQYTVLNPTPRKLRREMSADRPDFTESPHTVDAGAWQLEMSFFDYVNNSGDDVYSVAPFNLKVGVLNNLDFQLVFTPYQRSTPKHQANKNGVGDLQFRVKYNFWGNDGGKTAFGIMPFIKIPTAPKGLGNEKVEGGLILPFSVEINKYLDLGLMLETDMVYDEIEKDYDVGFTTSAVLGFELTEKWGGYVEGIAISNTDRDVDFRALAGAGITYSLNKDTMFDIGLNLGLTDKAEDVNLFSGVTFRF